MTDKTRCEPPPEWRDRDGWHWVQCTMGPRAAYNPEVFLWDVETGAWVVGDTLRALRNYRYLAPITPPSTVAALVEALEGLASAADHENWHLDCVLANVLADARAALQLYRIGAPPPTTKLYATPIQAAADAQRLPDGPPALLPLHFHLRAVVADPRASSDHLLILADALRTEATTTGLYIPSYAAQCMAWANTLTDLAPTRANPIEAT